ncbi:nucleoside triphosphate pyrophosphohydrolase family protein [Myxococcus eversor]|uniref:nucleoside triphosphate pyrophosphohydrolase family protein n=1 Tax=Myxococcus eversor TaxID=2709661 RepID=UPI0013D5C912|nr:nucleoside triphosphate pyrophosphohydrolase family protein [Myxococcus eversor]
MRLREYQTAASKTDQFQRRATKTKSKLTKAEVVPLLGLVGEVGTLLAEYKKLLRDGPGHLRFRDRLAEELGDTLWYVSAVATRFDLSLEKIAAANLKKVHERWSRPKRRAPLDASFPQKERLPRRFTYRFTYIPFKDGRPGVALLDYRGRQIGDLLTDNAHKVDGYRFHDVMHFAFVALLGWSPVARKLLNRKRRSRRKTDEVEDGGRANVIDEAIVAMVFDYIEHNLAATKEIARIDSETLRGVRALTRGFEVHARTEAEWEEAILKGLAVWRQVEAHDGGIVTGDFARRSFMFSPPDGRTKARAARRLTVAQGKKGS